MTWKEARIIAVGNLRRLKIPARLDGVVVQITDYDDEDTLRFLKTDEPDITLAGQRMINQAFAREIRKRGGRIEFVPLNINDYFGWLGKYGLDDCNVNRAQFISRVTCPEPKFAPQSPDFHDFNLKKPPLACR